MPNQRRIVLIIGLLSALIAGVVWISGCGGGSAPPARSQITLDATVNKSPAQTGSMDLFGTVPTGTDHIVAELPGGSKVPGTITATPPALPATITPNSVTPAAAATPGQWFFRLTLPPGASNVIIHAYSSATDTAEIGVPLTIAMNNTNAATPPARPTITITSPLGPPNGDGSLHVVGTCSTGNAADKIAVWRNGSRPPFETTPPVWMNAATSWAGDVQFYPGANRILAQAFSYIGNGDVANPNNYVASAVVSANADWTARAPTANITSPTNPPVPVYNDPAGAVNVQVAYTKNAASGSPDVNKVEVRFYKQSTTAPAWVSTAAASTATSKCVESPAGSPVTVPITLAARGNNVIEARAIAGYGVSAVSSVTVDFEPPVTAPTITSPATTPSTVTSTTLSLGGTISQDATASAVTRIEYQINGAGPWTSLGAPASGTGTNIAWGPFNITLTTFSNAIRVRGVTATGNGAAATVQVYCNPPPPAPVITAPPAVTSDATLSLSGTAAKNALAGTPGLDSITYSVDNGVTWKPWAALAGAGPWTINVLLASGPNTIVVKTRTATVAPATATESAVSSSVSVTYNSPAPVPVVTSPANNSTVTTAAAFVNVSGTATKGPGSAIDSIKFATGTAAGPTGTWTDISTLATKTFTAGNPTANWSAAIPLTNAQAWLYFRSVAAGQSGDPTATALHVYWNPPPTVAITGAPTLTPDLLVNTYTAQGTWASANPPADAYPVTNVQAKLGAATQNLTPVAGGTWTSNALTLAAGINSITAQAQAAASGVTTTNSTLRTLQVYYNPKPTVAFVSPAAGANVSSNTIEVSATQTGGRGIDGVMYSLNGGTSWSVLQTTKNLAGNYTFSPTLALGSNTVTVKAISSTQESSTVSRTFTYQPPPTITLTRIDDNSNPTSSDGIVYANIKATLSNTIGVTAVNFTSSPAGTTYDTVPVASGSGTPVAVFGRIDLRSLAATVNLMATSVGNVGSSTPLSFTNATSTMRAMYVQDIKGTGSQTLQVLLDANHWNNVSSVQVRLVYDHTKVTVNKAGAVNGSGVPAGSSPLTKGAGGGVSDDFVIFAVAGVSSGTTPPLAPFAGPQVLTMPVTVTAATGVRFYVSMATSGVGATSVTDLSNNDLTGLTTLVEGMIRSQ